MQRTVWPNWFSLRARQKLQEALTLIAQPKPFCVAVSDAVNAKFADELATVPDGPLEIVTVGATVSNVTERSAPTAVVVALPAGSLTENVPLGAIVTAPCALAVTVIVNVVPEPPTVRPVPLVTVKSAAVTVVASSDSLAVSVNWIDDVLVG